MVQLRREQHLDFYSLPEVLRPDWVVLAQGRKFPMTLTLVHGGADVTHEGKTHALRTQWRLGGSTTWPRR